MMMKESESDGRRPKSLEVGKYDSEDRLSRLPDPILCHILSFLPTKRAVATCILSSRWKFVWTWLSNLCFDDELCERPAINVHMDDALTKDTAQRFDKFVHRLSLPAIDPNFGITDSPVALNDDRCIRFENFTNRVLHLTNSVTLAKFSLQCSKLTNLSLQSKRVLELLEGVNEIKFMSLSAETMYALDWAYEDFFPTFPNLIYLNVEIRGTSRKLLLAILNSLPNLEVFVIHNHRLHDFGYIFDEPVPLCLLLHVKKIEMRNFKGYEHQFQLVKYFLKNSVSLEKAVVESQEMATQEKLKQCQELLMLERASKFCQVEFL